MASFDTACLINSYVTVKLMFIHQIQLDGDNHATREIAHAVLSWRKTADLGCYRHRNISGGRGVEGGLCWEASTSARK